MPEEREDQDCRDVEQEDRGDRVGDVGRRGSITGETAAMADPPQIPVPAPISVRRSLGTPSSRPYSQAAARQMASVPSMTGSEDTPTLAALGDRKLRAEQDHRALQDESARPLHPRREARARLDDDRYDGADERSGNRAADQRHVLPHDGRHCRDGERQREPGRNGLRAAGGAARAGGV
jgi:hypothetical protein